MRWLPLLSVLTPIVASAAGSEQVVVPSVQVSGVDATAGTVLTELLLEALLTRHGIHALGPGDVRDILGAEQQRQLVGCDDSRCLTELGGALGAGRLVAGSVGRLGDTFVLSARLVDTHSAQVVGRASRRFPRLEDAPEVVGPLVDELLGRLPLAKVDAPKLQRARKDAETTKKAQPVDGFCKVTLGRYEAAVLGPAGAPGTDGTQAPAREGPARLVQERRIVLEDLLFTQFATELDAKVACWRERDAAIEARLERLRLGAATAQEADRARTGAAEWAEARQGARLLVEAYRTGLEKEKLGTGARPIELPFALRPVHPTPRSGGEPEPRYLSAHGEAAPSLAAALSAVAAGDKAGFVDRFTAEGPEGRAAPRDLYVAALARADRARLDVCPLFVLEPEELAARARALVDTGRVVSCVRSVDEKDGAVTMTPVILAKQGGAWRIFDWPLPAGQ